MDEVALEDSLMAQQDSDKQGSSREHPKQREWNNHCVNIAQL